MSKEFTDLMLLVGTNPLPNYVVAKYFIQKNEDLNCIWLLCSEEQESIDQNSTQEIGERIKDVLRHEFCNRDLEFQFISIGDIGSARHIYYTIRNNIKDLTVGDRTFHLNYTGGTKTMAVHTYRTLEKLFKSNCTFSYLDGREHKIKFDDCSLKSDDLRLEISISLENLLDLHGHKEDPSKGKKDFSHAVTKFREIAKEKRELDHCDIKKINSEVDGSGDWLEQYVYEEIMCIIENDRELAERYDGGKISARRNFYSGRKQKFPGRKNFELDILVLNGYQVCSISCTVTKDENERKNKGFEVIHRSSQIGGDEAKSILVTCLSKDKITGFSEDLKDISGTSQDNLLVLGLSDLMPDRLQNKIKKYIWG